MQGVVLLVALLPIAFAITHLKIATILQQPYLETIPTTGNESSFQTCLENVIKNYAGFFADLVNLTPTAWFFPCTIYLVPDGKFGSLKADGNWTGIIGEIQKGHAHIGMAPLTVTKKRQEVVDFTVPFYTSYLSLLYRAGNVSQIDSLEDLIDSGRPFGPFNGGATMKLFSSASESEIQRKIGEKMLNKSALPSTVDEVIEMVRNENFVFIGESALTDFLAYKAPCDLRSVKLQIEVKHAFAIAKNQPEIKHALSRALLQQEQTGLLQNLQTKWWKGNCD